MEASSEPRIGRTVLAVAAPAFAVGGALIIALQPEPARAPFQPTTYASTGPFVFLLDRAAGLAMIGVGVVAWMGSARRRAGALAMLAGLLWLLPDLAGRAATTREIRAVAAGLAPLLAVSLAALMWELCPATRRSERVRGILASLAILAGVASAAVILVYDSSIDVTCWARCLDEPFVALGSASLMRGAQVVLLALIAATAALTVLGSVTSLRSRGPSRGWSRDLIGLSGLVLGITQLAVVVPTAVRYLNLRPLGLRLPAENPSLEPFRLAFVIQAVALITLAAGIAWRVLEEWRITARVRRIATAFETAPAPGSLQVALASALGDPTLRVRYWMEHEARFVDAGGRAVSDPGSTDGRSVITIRRAGQLVAEVSTASADDVPALGRELGSAALTALDNERLRAAVLDQIEALRASRVRIVELGDAERRRLERDLHDGAQQRLLAVSYDLRTARAAAAGAGRGDLTALLDRASEEMSAAVEELRRIAHGIHPAILSEAGLSVALAALSEETPVALEIVDRILGLRFPGAVEAAVHQLVAAAAADADVRGASHVKVELRVVDDRLVVELTDDGMAPPDAFSPVADRVWAAGGEIAVGSRPEGTSRWIHAELPCV